MGYDALVLVAQEVCDELEAAARAASDSKGSRKGSKGDLSRLAAALSLALRSSDSCIQVYSLVFACILSCIQQAESTALSIALRSADAEVRLSFAYVATKAEAEAATRAKLHRSQVRGSRSPLACWSLLPTP